jgi:hypothetical protein
MNMVAAFTKLGGKMSHGRKQKRDFLFMMFDLSGLVAHFKQAQAILLWVEVAEAG